jgi:hypothetical protein
LAVTNNEISIQRCKRLIEASLGWGDASSWSNEDFETLSEKIYTATSVRLSVSTLKRIWGKVRYDSHPTSATLNALARFAGYEGWRDLTVRTGSEESAGLEEIAEVSEDGKGGRLGETGVGAGPGGAVIEGGVEVRQDVGVKGRRRRMFTVMGMVLTIAVVGLLSFFGSRLKQRPADTVAAMGAGVSGVSFDAREVSDDLPNSVVFRFDASMLHPEKLMIQQSWDTTRREEIDPGSKEHTSLYYYPGFFTARLIADGQTMKMTDVFIRTRGWKGIIEKEPLPVYLKDDEIRDQKGDGIKNHGGLRVTAAILEEKTGISLFNGTWVEFDNVRDFGDMSADDFTFATTLRNTATVEQCLCRGVKVFILGTSSAIIIPLADKGCISGLNLLTGSEFIRGKDHDLSAFGCDFRQLQQLECVVKDHRLKIRLNKTQIFEVAQPRSIGKIIGVRVAFEGPGEIREMRLEGRGKGFDLVGSGAVL